MFRKFGKILYLLFVLSLIAQTGTFALSSRDSEAWCNFAHANHAAQSDQHSHDDDSGDSDAHHEVCCHSLPQLVMGPWQLSPSTGILSIAYFQIPSPTREFVPNPTYAVEVPPG